MALFYIVVSFTLIIALASTRKIDSKGTNSDSECETPICKIIAKDLLSRMNRKADPCTDFYNFTCDTYVKKAVIPDDAQHIGVFSEIYKKLYNDLKAILEKPPKRKDPPYKQFVHNFYKSCMDEKTIDKKGTGPMLDLLKKYGGWPIIEDNWTENNVSLTSILTKLFMNRQMGLLNIGIFPDDKNTSSHIIAIYQKAVRFPKDYYYKEKHNKMIEALRKFMLDTAKYLSTSKDKKQMDEDKIKKDIEDMINFEIQLAKINILPEKRRGQLQTKITLNELIKRANNNEKIKQFFNDIFKSVGYAVDPNEPIALYDLSYIFNLAQLLIQIPKRTIINYLLFDMIYSFEVTLSKKFQIIQAEYMLVAKGTSKNAPRWERCVNLANMLLYESLGVLYVKKRFKKSAKTKILKLIEEIKKSFKTMISQVPWMSDESKKFAIEKESKMRDKVAYPDYYDDNNPFPDLFKGVNIQPGTFQDNIIALLKLYTMKELNKLRKPVDHEKFDLKVTDVNAYYSFMGNSIIFPAAVLQMPFFSESSPMYFNFGGIGNIIGHEITHGFDDGGRKYDKDGMTNEWWKKEDIDNFENVTKCLVTQYSNFVDPTINVSVNGQLTLGENIADNGGVRAAYMAYQNWIKDNGKEQKLPGLPYSPEQLFFINYGRVFCDKLRPEYAARKNKLGVHTPGKLRLMGALMNLKEFTEVFNCPEKSVMNPENRCRVW